MAVIAGGKLSVSSGSNTATSGNSSADETPALVVSPVVITATGVTSEPVPAVVGTRIKGNRPPFTCSSPYSSGKDCTPASSTATTLATSIELPPPTAITPSTPASRALAKAAKTVLSGGSSQT